jgi:LPS-assembly protein
MQPQSEVSIASQEIPRATWLPPAKAPMPISWDSDTQRLDGSIYTLDGHVVVQFGEHTLYADKITLDTDTNELTLDGHVKVVGGPNDEHLEASHATYNVKDGTGRFYDVTGSIQVRAIVPDRATTTTVVGASNGPQRQAYTNTNPFLFRGRMVVKTGPTDYVVYDGSVTSCLLPHPDWQLYSGKFTLDNGKAHAANSTFRLLGIPVLFLPYVSHPTDATERQSGLLIPVFGYSSASNDTGSKGITIGEQVYLVVNRSIDLTVGTIYYSLRGFSENGTVRYRGPGDDFFTGHFSALQDRGFYQPTQVGTTKDGAPIVHDVHVNQGGQDITTAFRYRFTPFTRGVGDVEYLSSYIYRAAFTENFNQAVSSDITSVLYLAHQENGLSTAFRFDRYEGEKVVPVRNNAGEEVKIFHAPSIDFSGLEHRIPGTLLLYNVDASVAGLKRIQPNFVSSGITERLDLRPELSLPLAFKGWHTMSSIAVRETFYSRSRKAPYGNGATPVELTNPVNRADLEINIDIRPPAIERTFTTPKNLKWLLGTQVRHTIEPEITYRNVHGVDNFLSLLRFDDIDLVSDTDELRYGVLQHLYFRPRKPKPRPGCLVASAKTGSKEEPTLDLTPQPYVDDEPHATTDANGIPVADTSAPDQPTRTHARHADPCAPTGPIPQQEWFSWELAQKTFFAQNFGGAVIDSRRNIFSTTLDLSGIAFLTEARAISPVISRMRFRTSSHADVEWDFDYDPGAKKFNSSNTFFDIHEGSWFGGFSYAHLSAPGRFYTANISSVTNTVTGLTTSATSNFSQMRLLIGYGKPSRPGLSVAGGAGIDLKNKDSQYTTIQGGYNWNCCGLSLEYRQYNLGPIRDEGAYRFNFTLANIGSAGNLRRAEALF